MRPTYNDFVLAASGLLFERVQIDYGHMADGSEGLHFEIQVSGGLTDHQAAKRFGAFIRKHPTCGIGYNKPAELTAFEQALYNASQTVLALREGFRLEMVKLK